MTQFIRSTTNLGHAIRQARKEKWLTQTDLAQASGVWQETISKIETGAHNANLSTIFDLLAALDMEMTLTPRSKGSASDLESIF